MNGKLEAFWDNILNHNKAFKTIDEYIAASPKNVQSILQQLRKIIRETAPEAEETISYQMPAFRLNGILVYFAAFKNHVSFFPTSSAIQAFKEKLSPYKTSRGTVQFPLTEPIPFALVKEMVKFRVKENMGEKK